MKTFIIFISIFLLSIFQLKSQNADFSPNFKSNIKIPAFEEFSVLTTGSWTALPVTPHAVSRSCCVSVKHTDTVLIFQFGGGSGSQYTNVAKFNFKTNSWTNSIAVIPANMSAACAINCHDTAIILMGGESVGGLGKAFRFNTNTYTWTTLANMPSLVTDELLLSYHDSLVYSVCGGDGLFGATISNVVQLYNINQNSWQSATTFPASLSMVGGGIYGDTIIITGGWTGAAGSSTTRKGVINPSTPTTITWTTLANYPTGGVTRMASFAAGIPTTGIGILCTGGAVDGATITGATNFWNFCTQSWQTLPALTTPRSNFRGTGLGDSSVYVISGYNGSAGVGNCDKMLFTIIDGSCFTPVGIGNTQNEIPENYSLKQNYPNPFNPTTKIDFSIPKSANVEIKVIDILGREVATLMNEFKQAGNYSVDFYGGNISSGVYFYTLKSGDFKDTKKMLLVK